MSRSIRIHEFGDADVLRIETVALVPAYGASQLCAMRGSRPRYGALDARPTIVPPFDIFARDLAVRGVALPALARDDAKLAALRALACRREDQPDARGRPVRRQ